ncbi:putative transposase [Paenibacillus sp. BK033]|uniref:Mu transposase C-terminal domain-containing protein n=1 Tax=Paenibacillus sp. BK033 TaxID=2512133 RepID=UPI001048CFB3|nr:Mu transposase C-terminal domain-containing protein [Paenibacillus sp. BK033]TCM99385.1 putative transposase [Paenibacillus sp. BK033]
MSRFSFSFGTKFLMDGLEHIVLRSEKNEVVVELIKYKQKKQFSLNDLLIAYDEQRLVFEDPNQRISQVKQSIDQLLPAEKEKIHKKLLVLEPVIKGYFHRINLEEYLNGLRKERGISISKATFYNWKKIWDQYGDARLLQNLRPGPKNRRTDKEVLDYLQKIMDEKLYTGRDTTYREIYGEYKESILKVNELREVNDKVVLRSFQTIWRIVKEKRDLYKQQAAREGHVAANLDKYGARSFTERPTRPLQRAELDWTPVDIYLVDPKTLKRIKPWLVYMLDVFSGNPLGFYITFDYPDTFAIKQCLLHCFLPKVYLKKLYPDVEKEWNAYGIPREIVMDNASVNNSYELEEIFNFFGIDPLYPEVAAGHKKGTVERGFRTFNDIVHTLKGTTFSNMYKRKQYDSEGEACITLQTFYYIAHKIMVDIISHNYSRSRGGTPHEIWEAGLAEHPQLQYELPFSKRDITIALCGGREKRKITNRGVVLEGVQYYSSELLELRSKLRSDNQEDMEIIVRFDYADIRKVYVENPYDYSFIEAEMDPNQINDFEKHFSVEPSIPLPFQQIKAICLQQGREARNFDDSHIAKAKKRIAELQNKDEKDKKNNYQENLAEEIAILDGLALSSAGLDDDVISLEAPDTFKYIGEISANDLKKSKNKKNRLDKVDELPAIEVNIRDIVVPDDDLPDYDVSFLG